MDIKGNVQNLSDGRVKIIAEGHENDLEQFIQAIDIKDTVINVINIEKNYSDATGEYEGFYKLVNKGETDSRLDKAADLLKELIHVTKNGFDRLEKKQDETNKELKEVSLKIDQSRKEMTSEIRTFREDFKSHFDERLARLEYELIEMKAKLSSVKLKSDFQQSSGTKIRQT